ncbi:DoxX family membrane protein [Amphiplicatus metriothermophilus]|uniref:DoxX protein n=1 Tax=Amphiplicatus metriothermophilus TaxID=1519374 RepID=A0A239PIR0_9PROT|nr:DoxX family membrane protein [Amphiplicatus metriothermophilus]MBB5518149.1 putative membrane protein YphA (DoxX/SURF4 family) [Amphiplicatus metriothermophilus]SNT67517.1 DoxX protein [Amphiplicatus metriothermophilus]
MAVRAALLLALRVTTGALLVVWGTLKVMEPGYAARVSDAFYGGLLSGRALQAPLGWAEIALGALVILGLFRRIVYPLQALVLCAGALAVWKYILDPLGAWLLTPETRQYLFFPSSTLAVASLILVFFMEFDRLALDRALRRR